MTELGLTTSATDPDVAAAMVVFDRLKPLKDALGCKDLSDTELQLFAMVASHTGLDPFTKQIYAIKRSGKVTHQTGIDGYRSSAERTKEYRGSDEATFEVCDCGDAVKSPAVHPALARVVVYRAYPDGIRPQIGVARWHELKPDHFKPQNAYGFLDDMWWDMPWNQLAKCAEAAALRKAFPRVFGGVYIAEEMQRADTVEGVAVEVAPTASERLAAKRAAAQAPKPEPAAPADVLASAVDAEVVEGEVVETVQSQAAERVAEHRAERLADMPALTLSEFMLLKGEKGVQFGPDFTAAVEALTPGVPWAKYSDTQRHALAVVLGMIAAD